MEDGWRAGPSTRSQTYVSPIRHVRSSHARICNLSFGLLWSVVTGITEHEYSDHAMCLGVENLYTTERTSVLREGDLSFQIDIRKAFACTDADLSGKRIILIDDVVTTGATINECREELMKAGAAEVITISFAKGKDNGNSEDLAQKSAGK